MLRTWLIASLLVACGGSPASPRTPVDPATPADPEATTPAPGPVTAEARLLTAEETVKTAWDATITIPTSWYVTDGPEVVRIQDPDRELTLFLVAVKAADRDAAIGAAWKLVDPAFSLAVAQAVDLPGRDGWDAVGQVVYVTKTEERRAVVAVARRKGDIWHVALIDGKNAALDRRGAQVGSIIGDMKVPGLDEESFADATPVIDAERLGRFDQFAEEARELAGIPGVAVAVVHRGKIVFEKGYGVRSLGRPGKVTANTLFEIGSTTKSLTTLLLARLVDQGKLTWETPVVQVLPSFALADAQTTAQVTVQHTVCACTGMPRQDMEMLFEYAGWDPERRLASMKSMKPTTGFGETFQYSNLMVSTAGWIGGHVYASGKKLGPAYDEAMQKLLFDPLGMKSTTLDQRIARKREWADTHGRGLTLEYQRIPVEYELALAAVRPAGAAWSSVRDMSRYMMLELSRGKLPNGQQLVEEKNLLRRHLPQVKLDEDNAYGLGLFITDDHGVLVVHHGGNTLGHTADMFLLPAHDIGVVVLTNAAGANAYRSAMRRAFMEIVFDGKPEARENLTTSIDRMTKLLAEERALVQPADAAWIDPLLGAYENPELGRVELRRQGKLVLLDAGEWTSEVSKKVDRDGAIKIITTAPPYVGFELLPKQEGGKTVLVLDAGQHDYTFTPAAR